MIYKEQTDFGDFNPQYNAFVEKFKPKKTTDDCYTPPEIFEAIVEYACKRYGISRDDIVRPFYPGGNYEAFDYPDGCVVLDNPPFSITREIARFYQRHGVRFFLFSPTLTAFSGIPGVCSVVVGCDIVYANGAVVQTSFITNLEPGIAARSDPELCDQVNDTMARILRESKKQNPKYEYPPEIITAARLSFLSVHGVAFVVPENEAILVPELDHQRQFGKKIFGHGYLLSERLTAERVKAEEAAVYREKENGNVIAWKLSERERGLVRHLGKKES